MFSKPTPDISFALLKSGLDVQEPHLRGGWVEHPSLTSAAQQSVTENKVDIKLITPTVEAKHELLFSKPPTQVGMLNIHV
jgi:hypothetical protein